MEDLVSTESLYNEGSRDGDDEEKSAAHSICRMKCVNEVMTGNQIYLRGSKHAIEMVNSMHG